MHQIFYIDIDEEITSVIDRLKKSKTTENFFVVSPRSLILQSVVSLKLLKREAAKEKKQIAIVVNDEASGTKVEKAGILVLTSLRGLEGSEEVKENFSAQMEIKDSNNNKNNYKNIMEKDKAGKKTRLQKIGTSDFYSIGEEKVESQLPENQGLEGTKPNKMDSLPDSRGEIPVPSVAGLPEQKNTSDIRKENLTSFSYVPEKNFEQTFPNSQGNETAKNYGPNRISAMDNMDPYKERLVEGFFNQSQSSRSSSPSSPLGPNQEIQKEVPVSHTMRKIITGFLLFSFLIAIVAAGYLFLPKATVAVTTKSDIKKFDLEVKGNTNNSGISASDFSIPAKIIEKEVSFSDSFNSTGKKVSASDIKLKAKGKITIYNGYNSETQSLVATTRFISTDGKLFRLVKGINVPGMNGDNPGSIEADVIADQPGEEYNIGSSDFKIPGFEGSPKFDKFYAKSTSDMTGGGASATSGISIVSQSDLDNAKKDSEAKLKDQLEEEVKSEIGSGSVMLSDASEVTVSVSTASSRLNEVASNFDYKVSGKIKAAVFSESDFKKLAESVFNNANPGSEISDSTPIKLNYGAASADFGSGTMSVKANAEVPVGTNINWDDFKAQILGKNDEQIREVLKNYPQIEKINIDFWPTFMSQKIPQYAKRVVVTVAKSNE